MLDYTRSMGSLWEVAGTRAFPACPLCVPSVCKARLEPTSKMSGPSFSPQLCLKDLLEFPRGSCIRESRFSLTIVLVS